MEPLDHSDYSDVEDDDYATGPWYRNDCPYREEDVHERLTRELLDLEDWLKPKDDESYLRFLTAHRIATIIEGLNPAYSVFPQGSCATDTYIPTSDIDIIIMDRSSGPEIPQKRLIKTLRMIANELRKSIVGLQHLEVIAKAKVPIIKMTEPSFGFHIDICLGNINGALNIYRTRNLLTTKPAIRPLLIFFKLLVWAGAIDDPYVGGFGSNFLINFVHIGLQSRPDMANLGEMLIYLLELIAYRWNYYAVGAATCGDGFLFSKQLTNVRAKLPGALIIEDPQFHGSFLGVRTNALAFTEVCIKALEAIESNNYMKRSTLWSIFVNISGKSDGKFGLIVARRNVLSRIAEACKGPATDFVTALNNIDNINELEAKQQEGLQVKRNKQKEKRQARKKAEKERAKAFRKAEMELMMETEMETIMEARKAKVRKTEELMTQNKICDGQVEKSYIEYAVRDAELMKSPLETHDSMTIARVMRTLNYFIAKVQEISKITATEELQVAFRQLNAVMMDDHMLKVKQPRPTDVELVPIMIQMDMAMKHVMDAIEASGGDDAKRFVSYIQVELEYLKRITNLYSNTSAKPALEKKKTVRVCVSGIPDDVTVDDIAHHFQVGWKSVSETDGIRKFVFSSQEDAKAFSHALNYAMINGQEVTAWEDTSCNLSDHCVWMRHLAPGIYAFDVHCALESHGIEPLPVRITVEQCDTFTKACLYFLCEVHANKAMNKINDQFNSRVIGVSRNP